MITVEDIIKDKKIFINGESFRTVASRIGSDLLIGTERSRWNSEGWKDSFTAEVVARPEFQAALALELLTR